MLRIAAILYPMIGTIFAGIGVAAALMVPSLGLLTLEGVGWLAAAGFALGVPGALLTALPLTRGRRKTAA